MPSTAATADSCTTHASSRERSWSGPAAAALTPSHQTERTAHARLSFTFTLAYFLQDTLFTVVSAQYFSRICDKYFPCKNIFVFATGSVGFRKKYFVVPYIQHLTARGPVPGSTSTLSPRPGVPTPRPLIGRVTRCYGGCDWLLLTSLRCRESRNFSPSPASNEYLTLRDTRAARLAGRTYQRGFLLRKE